MSTTPFPKTIDLREMNRLLKVDPYSMTATIQAGALGPKLEEDLAQQGFNLGVGLDRDGLLACTLTQVPKVVFPVRVVVVHGAQ